VKNHKCELFHFYFSISSVFFRPTAVGKSKKLAKRNAALTMLNAVRQGNVEPSQVMESTEYDNESMQLVSHSVVLLLLNVMTVLQSTFDG